jgi:hypothetical protein
VLPRHAAVLTKLGMDMKVNVIDAELVCAPGVFRVLGFFGGKI